MTILEIIVQKLLPQKYKQLKCDSLALSLPISLCQITEVSSDIFLSLLNFSLRISESQNSESLFKGIAYRCNSGFINSSLKPQRVFIFSLKRSAKNYEVKRNNKVSIKI
jgi:hypothetical protein